MTEFQYAMCCFIFEIMCIIFFEIVCIAILLLIIKFR